MTAVRKKSTSVATVAFMAAAVASAAGAGWLFSRVLSAKYNSEPVAPIVVAARDVPAGERMERKDLRIAQWPISSVPRGAFRTRKAVLARRSVPLVPLVAGSAVLTAHLSKPNGGMGVAATLEPGQRAVSIRVDMSVAFSRLLYPGAHIDLFTTLKKRRRDGSYTAQTRPLLQDIRVLAIGPDIDAASAEHRRIGRRRRGGGFSGGGAQQAARARRVVTFALTPEQVSTFILARREGKIDLALRSPKDKGKAKVEGTKLSTLLGKDDDDDKDRADAKANRRPVATAKQPPRRPRRARRRRRRRPKPAPKAAPPAAKKPSGPRIERW
ncbi:MAG: Flp pilus assembly protein CpaB [Myxococcales bacterium]|nr:Flp pilus assembly protein CpaB [Myxococcales bacterium]